MAAGRNVDFTQKEMEEMTGLDRTRFKRNLEKVCEMYKFDINNFKKKKIIQIVILLFRQK